VPDYAVRERGDRQRSAAAKASRFTSAPLSAPVAAPGPAPTADQRRGGKTAEPAAAPAAAPAADPSKFPGGIVPTRLPPKRMFGKIRSGRR
jgi:hypothetical protein